MHDLIMKKSVALYFKAFLACWIVGAAGTIDIFAYIPFLNRYSAIKL